MSFLEISSFFFFQTKMLQKYTRVFYRRGEMMQQKWLHTVTLQPRVTGNAIRGTCKKKKRIFFFCNLKCASREVITHKGSDDWVLAKTVTACLQLFSVGRMGMNWEVGCSTGLLVWHKGDSQSCFLFCYFIYLFCLEWGGGLKRKLCFPDLLLEGEEANTQSLW